MIHRDSITSPDLDDPSWATLLESLEQFEQAWGVDHCPDLAAFIPSVDPLLQDQILTELIKVDLDYRRRTQHQKHLEEYLNEWPQLRGEAVVELLESECLIRFIEGESLTREELETRFPDIGPAIDLSALSDEARRERTADFAAMTTTCQSATETHSQYCLTSGQRFGRYEIMKLLGTGSMGTVFQAYDPNLDRQVALKIPRSGSPHALDRFLREARLAAKIRHPNVCPIYDAGRVDGIYYLTMALIDGPTLSEHMKSHHCQPRDAAELVRQVAVALHRVHDQGIVHRDVKPSNVMLEASGQPLLMDFGLARGSEAEPPDLGAATESAGASTKLSASGPLIGTPAYMSPEQVQNQPVDPRTDVYSLGVLFYQLLTTELPYTGSVEQVLQQILHATVAKPRDIVPTIPEPLEGICVQAMAKAPEARFQSAQEFASALEHYLRESRVRVLRPLLVAVAIVVLGFSGAWLYFTTGNGILELELPSNASVVVDNVAREAPPGKSTLALSVGRHRIQVFCQGAQIADQELTIRWRGERLTGYIAPVAAGWNREGYDPGRTFHYPFPTRRRTTDRLERVAWNTTKPHDSIASLRTGDLNGDGNLEIVARAGKNVIAFDRYGRELWRQTPIEDADLTIPPGHVDLPAHIELVDFDRDGSLEVLTLASANPPEEWIRSSVVKAVVYDSSGSRVGCTTVFEQVALAHGEPAGCFDFNCDGFPDLVFALSVYKHPHGIFIYDGVSQQELFTALFADHPRLAGVGDVDNDGAQELFLLQEWDSHVDEPVADYDAHHCYATLFELDGKRKWKQKYTDCLDGCLADVDADGVLDMVLFHMSAEQGALHILDPATGNPRTSLKGFGNQLFRRWSVADINGDGFLEILLGDGQQVLAVSAEGQLLHSTPLHETRVAATNDLDGDGKIEVIAFQAADLIVLDGTLRELARYVASGTIQDVVISDIDSNGVNELILQVVGSGSNGTVGLEIIHFAVAQGQRPNMMLPENVASAFLAALRCNNLDTAMALTLSNERENMRTTLAQHNPSSLPSNAQVTIFRKPGGSAHATIQSDNDRLALELQYQDGRWWILDMQ